MAGERPEAERNIAPWPLISACRSGGISLLALLAFSMEGDNIGDAVKLATAAKRCLQHVAGVEVVAGTHVEWRFPESWQSVYGRPQGLAVY